MLQLVTQNRDTIKYNIQILTKSAYAVRSDFKALADALVSNPMISLNLTQNYEDFPNICSYLEEHPEAVFMGDSVQQIGFCKDGKVRNEYCVYAGIKSGLMI